MSFGELMKWITTSKDVTSLLLAIEAVITWVKDDGRMFSGTIIRNKVNTDVMEVTLLKLINERNWPLLPEYFLNYENLIARQNAIRPEQIFVSFNWRPYCVSKIRNKQCKYVIIEGETNPSDPASAWPMNKNADFLRETMVMNWLKKRDGKISFHFKHPRVAKPCKQPGNCGFILDVVPDEAASFNLRLSKDKADYKNHSIHFHDEIQAEKMHVYLTDRKIIERELEMMIPYSWSENLLTQAISYNTVFLSSSFRVLYFLD